MSLFRELIIDLAGIIGSFLCFAKQCLKNKKYIYQMKFSNTENQKQEQNIENFSKSNTSKKIKY